jgi:hypothetical protein
VTREISAAARSPRVLPVSTAALPWVVVSGVLLVAGLVEIAEDRWDSPWPVSVVVLLLVGLPVAVVARRPVLAATVLCLAFGVECLVWSTPQSFAALLALVSVAAGAARYTPTRALLPVLGLLALTVVVVLTPDPGEDAAFDYLLTSGICAVATAAGLLARSGHDVLARVSALRPAAARTRAAGARVLEAEGTPAPTRTQVFVHIGLPKTGTSLLQSAFARSEEALRRQGLALLPCEETTAFQVMLDLRDELRPELDPPESYGAVDRLVQQVTEEHLPRVLVSQELLSLATAEQAGRLVAALGDAEVHLVLTVRDLARQLPSLWQQQVKARGVTSFDGFLDRVMDDGSGAVRGYDVLAVLEQWRTHVPPERTHVVTVPRPGSAGGLPARFCRVLGVDPATVDISGGHPNRSLGLTQAELLRRVNVALGPRLPHARAGYRGPGKRFLAETILIQQGGVPPRLPQRVRPWVEKRSRQVVEELGARPFDVVGDLDELVPDPAAFASAEAPVTEAELLDAATEALAAVLVDRAENPRRRRRPAD